MSPRYAACVRVDPSVPIDVARASAQHEAYVAAVRDLGIPIDVLPADEASPDCCFLEDTAVVTGAHALATCPGAPSRRAEVAPVADALARTLTVHRMDAPATLDGGDVLRVDSRLFVGLSSRTNREGVAALAKVASLDGLEVVPVVVRGGLHLKSACSLASASLLVHDPALLAGADLAPFRAAGLELVPSPEATGANVLALGGTVFVSKGAPKTAETLRAQNIDVVVLDVAELHKGDGALTCLSLRIPGAGCWST
jgi:dimethylargininase